MSALMRVACRILELHLWRVAPFVSLGDASQKPALQILHDFPEGEDQSGRYVIISKILSGLRERRPDGRQYSMGTVSL